MRPAASITIACLLISLSPDAKAQQETKPRREGVITGRVIADGRPGAGAQVMVLPSGGKLGDFQTVTSDADGNFKAPGLGPGAYSFSTQIPGYVALPDPSGPRQYRIGENVTINLIKGGVITGRVTDEFGEPMVGVRVVAQRVRTLEEKPEIDYNVVNVGAAGRETDDRGVYRLFGLAPGVYVVGLNGLSFSAPVVAQSRSELPVYHPSSTRNTAAEVAVHSGGEASGIDIRRHVMRGHSISGLVSGDAGSGGIINIVAVILSRAADRQPVAMTPLPGEGNFSVRGVEDGECDVFAMRFNERMDYSTSVPRRVTVKGADVSGIEVKLVKLGSIEGRVVIEPSKQSDACKRDDDFSIEEILLNARRDEKTPSLLAALTSIEMLGGFGNAAPTGDGAFALKNLEQGRIRIEADLPSESWYLRAITQRSSAAAKPLDISQNGIAVKSGEKVPGVEVMVAESAATLKGKIVPTHEKANLSKRIRVHLVPAEVAAANDALRYSERIVGDDGSFEFKNIAPGKYWLHARQAAEKESSEDQIRPVAWDAAERAKLRREAEAAGNEIELKPCARVKDHILRPQTK